MSSYADYTVDDHGRVTERITGAYLGRVDAVEHAWGDTLYWPLDCTGREVRRPTMIRDLAVLAIVRSARPESKITLRDIHG